MKRRFVHLGINPLGSVANQPGAQWPPDFNAVLQRLLDQVAHDWYRYASQNYVLWTSIDLDELARRVNALPGFQNTYVFVTEMPGILAPQCNGWMAPVFWNWIRKTRP